MEEGREDEWISSWHRWRHSLWLHCAIEAGFLLKQLMICTQPCPYCYLLVTSALLNRGGQPIIQVGLLWIPHSIEAGLFVSNVYSVAMLPFPEGGVIDKDAITFGLPTIVFGNKKWAVITSSYHMKLLIARKLQQIPLPTGRCFTNGFFCFLTLFQKGGASRLIRQNKHPYTSSLQGGTATPSAVWVRQIRKDCGNGGEVFPTITHLKVKSLPLLGCYSCFLLISWAKARLRVSPLCKTIQCHATNLVGFRTSREKIAGFSIHVY